MRFGRIWNLTILAAGLALPAEAIPFYVRSIVNATTSGNILDGHFASQDTGQVAALMNLAGPVGASSGNTFYSFNATAWAETEIGVQHGYATASASSTGPAGGAVANSQSQWSDTITITSNTLAPGTLVSFLATITLDRTITGTLPASASADVTGPFGLHLIDSLSSPNSTQSVSTVVTTTIGSVLTATSTLSLSVGASGIAPFGLSGAVHAENTSIFRLDPITPGASYSTASGAGFLSTPEPAAVLSVLGGLAAIAIRRIRFARSH